MLSKSIRLLFFICLCTPISAQKLDIGGYIYDKENRETVPSVVVVSVKTQAVTTSNNYGYYALSFENIEGDTLLFSSMGFATFRLPVSAFGKDNRVDIQLEKSSFTLSEVEIKDKQISRYSGQNVVSKAQIRTLPALLGEKDAMKVLQLLPGVQRGNEGNSGLYVRGGTPDQNLVLLDEAPVYNINHFFGLFSVFNGDAIKDLSFYKGNIPAKYGGRLSSVLDFVMYDGNKETWKTEGGIGLLSSRIVVQGPLIKEKASILIAARRSYFDVLATPLINATSGTQFAYFFHDYNLKSNYNINKNNYLIFSAYFGKDKYNFSEASIAGTKTKNYNRFFWYNTTATLRWNHIGQNNSFSHTSLIFNNYRFSVGNQQIQSITNDTTQSLYTQSSSGIRDFSLKHEWSKAFLKHELKIGGVVTSHLFTPTDITYKNDAAPLSNFSDKETINSLEYAAFIEDKIKLSKPLELNVGIRFSGMNYDQINRFFPEPRLVLNYKTDKLLDINVGYTRTNQFLQLLSNTGVSLPTDFWLPSTKNIQPQQADQIGIGFKKYTVEKNWEMSLEVYYKNLKNIAAYAEGSSFIDIENPNKAVPQLVDWRNIILQGKGKSAGVEVLIEKKTGELTGWLSYTLAKTRHQFDAINNGKIFYPLFDRRHTLNITSVYKPSKKITFAATWALASPNPVAVPVKTIPLSIDDELTYAAFYGERGQVRERWFHRLDVSVQFHKQKKRFLRTWEIGIFNAYNRKNPFLYALETKKLPSKSEQFIVSAKSIFVMIPNISYNFSF